MCANNLIEVGLCAGNYELKCTDGEMVKCSTRIETGKILINKG